MSFSFQSREVINRMTDAEFHAYQRRANDAILAEFDIAPLVPPVVVNDAALSDGSGQVRAAGGASVLQTQNGKAVFTPKSANGSSEPSRKKQNGKAVSTQKRANGSLSVPLKQCKFASLGFHCGNCTQVLPGACWAV